MKVYLYNLCLFFVLFSAAATMYLLFVLSAVVCFSRRSWQRVSAIRFERFLVNNERVKGRERIGWTRLNQSKEYKEEDEKKCNDIRCKEKSLKQKKIDDDDTADVQGISNTSQISLWPFHFSWAFHFSFLFYNNKRRKKDSGSIYM